MIRRMANGAFLSAAGLAIVFGVHGGPISVDMAKFLCWLAVAAAVASRIARAPT